MSETKLYGYDRSGALRWDVAMPPEVAKWLTANPPSIELFAPPPVDLVQVVAAATEAGRLAGIEQSAKYMEEEGDAVYADQIRELK